MPVLFSILKSEGLGVLTLMWALIGYFSLFDFGVGRSLTYHMSESELRSESENEQLVQTGVLLTIATGIVGCVLVALLAKYCLVGLLKISSTSEKDVLLAFYICTLGIIPTTLGSGLRGVLEGTNKFFESNLNRMIGGSLLFILPTLSALMFGNELVPIACFLVVGRYIIAIDLLFKTKKYFSRISRMSLQSTRLILTYGGWITISGIIGPLMVFGDRFLVGATLGAEALPQYAIPQEALLRLLIIPMALSSALLPQMASSSGRKLKSIYKDNLTKTALLMLCICSLAVLAIGPVLSLWLSPAFAEKTLSISTILIVGIFFNSLSLIPFTLLHAVGLPKVTAIFHIAELFIYVILLLTLTEYMGLLGAAIAWTSRIIVDLILLAYAASKILKNTSYLST